MTLRILQTLTLTMALSPPVLLAQDTPAPSTDRYSELMQRATSIAKQYSDTDDGDVDRKALHRSLTETLNEAFELRQKMQRSEIARTRKELDDLEARINEREKQKDQMIAAKLEAMLAGADIWWRPEEKPSEPAIRDTIEPGDIVAVFIEGILPYNGPGQEMKPPPITKLDSGAVVTGFPLPVASDGTVALPLVEPIKISGLKIRQAESVIRERYIDENILRPEKSRPILTLVPRTTAGTTDNAKIDLSQIDVNQLLQLMVEQDRLRQTLGPEHPKVKLLQQRYNATLEGLLRLTRGDVDPATQGKDALSSPPSSEQ